MITATIITFLLFMMLCIPILTFIKDLIFGFVTEADYLVPIISFVLYVIMWLEVNKYF